MKNNVVKCIDVKLQNCITGNESDNDENEEEIGSVVGIMPDTRFTFDQIEHEYTKYVLKNHKYFYDKAVVRKVSLYTSCISEMTFFAFVKIRLSID